MADTLLNIRFLGSCENWELGGLLRTRPVVPSGDSTDVSRRLEDACWEAGFLDSARLPVWRIGRSDPVRGLC